MLSQEEQCSFVRMYTRCEAWEKEMLFERVTRRGGDRGDPKSRASRQGDDRNPAGLGTIPPCLHAYTHHFPNATDRLSKGMPSFSLSTNSAPSQSINLILGKTLKLGFIWLNFLPAMNETKGEIRCSTAEIPANPTINPSSLLLPPDEHDDVEAGKSGHVHILCSRMHPGRAHLPFTPSLHPSSNRSSEIVGIV